MAIKATPRIPAWVYQWEAELIRMLPAYTLEILAECDIDTLLPFYYANTQSAIVEPHETDNVVYRDGRPYKVVKAGKSDWANNIF